MVMALSCIQRLLLLLSGDVETNPGPLGHHNEDPMFTFKNIINALETVVEWKALGTQLDISAAKIKEIDVNNRGQVADCKHDLVHFWLESDTSCSWKKLVDALSRCHQLVLAERIKTTYCHEGLVQMIHDLFKTQDPDFIRKRFETERTFDFTLQALSPHDCYALNYCIVMSKVEIDLRLDSSNISEEGFSMLLQPIAGMKSVFCFVKKLIVTKTFSVKSKISDICLTLMNNSCLTSLWIEECDIDAKVAECIEKLLLQTKSLQRIVLNANPIHDQGATHIGAGLTINHSVKYLCIENCGITHDGLKAISQGLTQNKTLVELNISGNTVGNNGISLLCNELKSGSSLKKLLLHRCIVDPDDECIQSLRALSEKDDLTICIDYPIEQLLRLKQPANMIDDKQKEGQHVQKKTLHVYHEADAEKVYSSHFETPSKEEGENIANKKRTHYQHVDSLHMTMLTQDRLFFYDYVNRPHQFLIMKTQVDTQHKHNMGSIEPERRNAGCGVIVGEKLFVWGGQTEKNGKIGGMRYLPCSESHPFDVWDFKTQTWSHQPTTGDVPELGIGSSLTAYCRWLYLYGGLTEYDKNVFAGDVYRVSLDTFKWEMIPIPSASITTIKPSPRYTTGIILYNHKLCMFGGVGPEIVKDQDPGAEWVKAVNRDMGSFGWNNEYYEFDLKNECWSAPLGRDAYRPKPIGSFSFCKFSSHKAILFGGNGSEDNGRSYSDRLYHFDLESHVWTHPVAHSVPWPTGCRFHTMSPLFDPECDTAGSVASHWMVLLWGKASTGTINKDGWALNAQTWKWKKLLLCESLKPRAWHIACAHYAQRDIVVFGGNMVVDEDFYQGRDAVANLQLIPFDQILEQVQCDSVITTTDQF